MRKYLITVDRNRAQKLTRLANLIIDRIIILLIFIAFGAISALIFNVTGSDLFLNITMKLSQVNRFWDILITSIVYFTYALLMEYFTKGRTIGKYITGSKVVCIDGTQPTFNDYFIRNISRLVPFDVLSFLGENGWHDKWSETRVINIKNYQAEIQAKSEIEALGTKEIA